jgi:tetratricopeptide (TPR) repeat protein
VNGHCGEEYNTYQTTRGALIQIVRFKIAAAKPNETTATASGIIELAMCPRSALLFVAVIALATPALAADHWTRLTNPDFELYTTASEKDGRDTIRHFEQVREFFLRVSPVRSLGDFPLRIFQFDTESQYKPFRPNEFTIAYFVATPAREYIVMGDRASKDFGSAIHEYTHLIVRRSGLKIPTWLNEGWADVFSTLRPMGKDTAVGDLRPDRMKSLDTEQWMSFDALTSVDSNSPTYHEASRVGIFYAESWALTHMLFLAPEYKDNFGKFVMALHSGKSSAEACEIAFGKSSSAVFKDLHAYFDRKKLYGTVFETGLDSRDEAIASTALPEFDSQLALADLMVAIGKRAEAKTEYARLEKEQPDRPDLNQSLGNIALWNRDMNTARQYFEKAYDAGDADARLCFELAMLEREAKQPPAKIIPILERSLKSKPDFTDAKVQLGLTRIDVRDFTGAVSTLMSIPKITPQYAPPVYCGLAYARVQTGDLEGARQDAGTCSKWAKTDADTNRAERILKFIEARSKPSVAVHPGEKLERVAGVARNLQCSPEGNRLEVAVGNKLVAFDMPDPAAIEMPAAPLASFTFTCGALTPVRLGIEFAPPRSAIETSAGIVRRFEY